MTVQLSHIPRRLRDLNDTMHDTLNKSMQCHTKKSLTRRIDKSLLSKDMIKKRNESVITSSQHCVALQKPEKEKIDVTKTFTIIFHLKGHGPRYFR